MTTEYEWRDWDRSKGDPWSGLLPTDELNNYSMRRIASIYRDGRGQWQSSYYWPHSTGNKQGSWAIHKTRRRAKRWVEAQLARFWEPPIIAA